VGEAVLRGVAERTGAQEGDLVLMSAGVPAALNPALGELRQRLAHARGLVPQEVWAPAWVTDFPLFKEGEEGRLESEHHPFTAPHDEDLVSLEESPLSARAKCYDLVLNGVELASGSIRVHRRDIQQRILSLLGIDEREAERRFGFFLRALDYGAPPHGGIAFGLDRWVMMLAGERTLREVIAFPKTAGGSCPLTGAPAPADPAQLKELGLTVEGWAEDESWSASL
ncbi:MAG: amino acid--tRNA ligase-related protein, partial [Candidatus Bipolaricaulota bacterium]